MSATALPQATSTGVPAAGRPNSPAASPPRANTSHQARGPPARAGQPELPGAKASSPAGTVNTPSLTTASADASPMRTVTRVPAGAGAASQVVLRLPYP